MESKPFTYNYSAARNKEIESIRKKYMPHEESKLETLKRLDNRVQSAGMLVGLCLGLGGALLFGVGMCFGLGALVGAAWLKYLFGAVGVAVMIPAYPVYKRIAKKVKAELTPEILRLSEELMKNPSGDLKQ